MWLLPKRNHNDVEEGKNVGRVSKENMTAKQKLYITGKMNYGKSENIVDSFARNVVIVYAS